MALKKYAAGLEEIALRGLDLFVRLQLTRSAADPLGQWHLAQQYGLSAYDAAYLQLALVIRLMHLLQTL